MQVEYQLDARGDEAGADQRTDVNGGRRVIALARILNSEPDRAPLKSMLQQPECAGSPVGRAR